MPSQTAPAPSSAKIEPLRPGELREALRQTRNMIGLLGLKWASLVRRAVAGGK